MAQSRVPKKAPRLGTRLRGKLSEAYASRGHLASKLIYAYSARMRKDFVLKSELEFWHFISLEADPRIAEVDYNPKKLIVTVGNDAHGTVLDAIVTYKDGTVEWREVKYADDNQIRTRHQQEAQEQASHEAGAVYCRITEKDIFGSGELWLLNWLDVIAWLSELRERPTLEFDLAVAKIVSEREVVTIADIQSLGRTRAESSCYVAAAFKRVQNGDFASDLHIAPLTLNTLITIER